MSRVLISSNAAWNIVNFRSGLVRALIADGHEVVAALPEDDARVGALGVRTIVVPMARGGASILADLVLICRFVALMRRERPDVFLGWTIKPNVYGAFAAQILGIPMIANISGLGTAFIRSNWLMAIAKRLYRIGLRRAATVFFQNADDRALFIDAKLVPVDRTAMLPGSGIDVAAYDPDAYPRPYANIFRFLLIARLIRDKGVYEYVAAARIVAALHPDVRFDILGPLDPGNRTAIDTATLTNWVEDGSITYLGAVDDVRPAIAFADCVVLPSYREGISHVLLEAAAMARPSIATDVPGCRDVVVDGRTGLLCRVRDVHDLAAKMASMLAIPPPARAAMGKAARADVIARFSETVVIDRYRRAIADAVRR